MVHAVALSSPIDYSAIFKAADRVLGAIAGGDNPGQLSIHLSPGTPAMTAVWVLLGKSRYPAEFFQTYSGRVIPTEIPFDLIVDFLPEVLTGSNRAIQDQAATTGPTGGFESVLGQSAVIRAALNRARRFALRDVSVLILGESGVGKEVFARGIHEASPRRAAAFVAINCAAVPKDLLESELFGHKKGGFTGATADRKGAFEEADKGTLFLDEVGECDLAMQAKLLRVLQPPPDKAPSYRVFRRVGDSEDRASDVRVVAATNRDLQIEIRAGRFREDLFYRLAPLTLRVPPLRERLTDIPVIVERELERINMLFAATELGYRHKRISAKTKQFLCRQSWPGNVRQLQNVLTQAAVMVDGEVIEPTDVELALSDIPGAGAPDVLGLPLGDGFELVRHLENIQRHFLARAMREAQGKKTEAAKLLGYSNYQTLDAQLKRLKV